MLSDVEIGEELDAAVYQFSDHRPRYATFDYPGTDSSYIDLSAVQGWISSWSAPYSVEYPAELVGVDNVPQQLSTDSYQFYRDEDKAYILMRGFSPAATELVRITFRVPHALLTTVTGDDTIPSVYFDAVCNLASAFCLRRLGNKFAKQMEPTLGAEFATYRDATQRYKTQADVFEDQYRRRLGLPSLREYQKSGAVTYGTTVRTWYPRTTIGALRLFHGPGSNL
jgi:hypothetical protein